MFHIKKCETLKTFNKYPSLMMNLLKNPLLYLSTTLGFLYLTLDNYYKIPDLMNAH